MTRKYRNLFFILVVVTLNGEAQVRKEGFLTIVNWWMVLGVGEIGLELLKASLQEGGELLVLCLVVARTPIVALAILATLYFYYQHYY
jgi:hypothetical protein